jgi:hypothetical protein
MEKRKARIETAVHRLEEQETLVAIYKEVNDSSEISTRMLQALERTLAKFRADVTRLSK